MIIIMIVDPNMVENISGVRGLRWSGDWLEIPGRESCGSSDSDDDIMTMAVGRNGVALKLVGGQTICGRLWLANRTRYV